LAGQALFIWGHMKTKNLRVIKKIVREINYYCELVARELAAEQIGTGGKQPDNYVSLNHEATELANSFSADFYDN